MKEQAQEIPVRESSNKGKKFDTLVLDDPTIIDYLSDQPSAKKSITGA